MVIKQVGSQNFLRSFAFETKEARVYWGLSREELADRSGMHINTIGMMERGEHDLNSISQTKILMALGCEKVFLDAEGLHFHLRSSGPFNRGEGLFSLPVSEITRGMGADIHTLRLAQGLSLNDLSNKSNLHLNTVWNCELGLVSLRGYSWYCLLHALGISAVMPQKLE